MIERHDGVQMFGRWGEEALHASDKWACHFGTFTHAAVSGKMGFGA